jgi:hypothetical protein
MARRSLGAWPALCPAAIAIEHYGYVLWQVCRGKPAL